MEKFEYSPINLERPAFRLLRLLGPENSEIECELFDAFLEEREEVISYEAVSYTWRFPLLEDSILVNGKELKITHSLYVALQRLQEQEPHRVLWIDAICIDQRNKKERGHQVSHMSKIYRSADRVICWLGPGTYKTNGLMESLKILEREGMKQASCSWRLEDNR
jgi:hypothetical protein